MGYGVIRRPSLSFDGKGQAVLVHPQRNLAAKHYADIATLNQNQVSISLKQVFDDLKQTQIAICTSVESCNRTLHFQAGNSPLQPMDKNENCTYLYGNSIQILTHHFIQLQVRLEKLPSHFYCPPLSVVLRYS
jgi:hypothetical protein